MTDSIVVRHLGIQPYASSLGRMHDFTDSRAAKTPDELWVLQHPGVYTLGQAGDFAHILDAGDIEVIKSDRGGQVTYHGLGQVVIYAMIDLRRRNLGVRSLVSLIENTVIEFLQRFAIESVSRRDAPGVYVSNNKIAALGLRVRRGCSFHGLALNVSMDLEPFSRINPCGYRGLGVTQLRDLTAGPLVQSVEEIGALLSQDLTNNLQRHAD